MTDCQPMPGQRKSYATVRLDGSLVYAHRLAFALGHGVDPAGMVVRHKCDNFNCVNPEHLELGSIADNMRDKIRSGVHRGERNPGAKLSEQDVRSVRVLLGLGENCSSVARLLGVSDVAIGLIKRGKTW